MDRQAIGLQIISVERAKDKGKNKSSSSLLQVAKIRTSLELLLVLLEVAEASKSHAQAKWP